MDAEVHDSTSEHFFDILTAVEYVSNCLNTCHTCLVSLLSPVFSSVLRTIRGIGSDISLKSFQTFILSLSERRERIKQAKGYML